MQHYLSRNIDRLLVFVSLLATCAIARADKDECAIVRESIETGAQVRKSDADSCVDGIDTSQLFALTTKAVEYRQAEIALQLYKPAFDVDSAVQLFHLAALYEQPLLLVDMLGDYPELLEARDRYGRTPLSTAAIGRSYLSARVILENGANQDIGQSLVAAVGRSREIAYLIIENNSSWMNGVGDVLGNALRYTDEAFLQYLLLQGVDPNATDSDGYYVLLHAPKHEDESIGHRNWVFMVSHGANETAAICSIEKGLVDHIVHNAPTWFAGLVSAVHPRCP